MTNRVVHTYCAQCMSFCAMLCYVEGDRLVRVRPDRDHPAGGSLCPKGLAASEVIYSPERVLYPLRRTKPKGESDPGWERITWDEALDLVAARISAIKEKYGPEGIAVYRGAKGGTPSADYEPLVLRLANCLGTPNFITTGHICQWHRDSGSRYTYGAGIPAPDLEESQAILIWGFNPANTWNNFYRALRRAKKRGAKLVVVDPRRTQLAEMADLWLRVRPGGDGALAMSLLNVMVTEGLYDEEFVRDWTNAPFLVREQGGELVHALELTVGTGNRLEPVIEQLRVDSPLGGNHVPTEPATETVLWEDLLAWDVLGNSPIVYRPSLHDFIGRFTARGIEPIVKGERVQPGLKGRYAISQRNGTQILCLPVWQRLLHVLEDFCPEATEAFTWVPAKMVRETGRLLGSSRPWSYYSYNGIEQHTNAMQTNRALCILYAITGDLGKPGGNVWWPKVPTNDLAGREFLPAEQQAKRLGLAERPLGPAATGRVAASDFYTAVLEGRPYQVKALLAFGGDLPMANGDSRRGFEALKALDFYLQVDLFLTPAAQLADIVLPAATPWEGWFVRPGFGLTRATAAHVQLRERVVPPQGESRPDQELVMALAVKLGLGEKFWEGDLQKALDHYLEPSGLTVEKLRQHRGGISYPLQPVFGVHALRSPTTGVFQGFDTPSGRVELYSSVLARHGYSPLPNAQDLKEDPLGKWAKDFPLILTNFKLREFCHGQHRAIPSLRRRIRHPYVEIHPDTAASLGLAEGEWISLETPRGKIRVKVKITDRVLPQVVATQHGWWQGCPPLGLPAYDPLSTHGSNVNLVVTNEVQDPISGSIPHKSYRCRLVKER